MSVSSILNNAADLYLQADGPRTHEDECLFSCNAVAVSLKMAVASSNTEKRVQRFLRTHGLPDNASDQMDMTKDPQGTRYMWLKFMALLARDKRI